MQCTEPPDQIKTVNGDDLATAKAAGQNLDGLRVALRLSKGGHQNRAVEDEEIRIAGRHPPGAAKARCRHGQLDEFESTACLSPFGA